MRNVFLIEWKKLEQIKCVNVLLGLEHWQCEGHIESVGVFFFFFQNKCIFAGLNMPEITQNFAHMPDSAEMCIAEWLNSAPRRQILKIEPLTPDWRR